MDFLNFFNFAKPLRRKKKRLLETTEMRMLRRSLISKPDKFRPTLPLKLDERWCRAYAENSRVTSWHRRIERDDWLWLETEQTHVTDVAVAVTHPDVSTLLHVDTVDRGGAGELKKKCTTVYYARRKLMATTIMNNSGRVV